MAPVAVLDAHDRVTYTNEVPLLKGKIPRSLDVPFYTDEHFYLLPETLLVTLSKLFTQQSK